VERLVGERDHVVDRVQVADRRVDVDRLDGVAAKKWIELSIWNSRTRFW
jgi:hypothetical protein